MAKSVSQSIPDDSGMQGDFLYCFFFYYFVKLFVSGFMY